jgi:hypothetical protein
MIHGFSTPPRRMNSAMVYDQAKGKIVMFGGLAEWGEPPLDDLWVLDPVDEGWQEVSSEPIVVEEKEIEPSQIGIPGFPIQSILLGLILFILLSRVHKSPWNVSPRF